MRINIKDFDAKKVTLEDWYKNDEYETMTLYFEAPKEWLNGLYPDAVSAEISVEYPLKYPEASEATVMISPTRDLGEDGYEDYDWNDLELPLPDIEALIGMAKA